MKKNAADQILDALANIETVLGEIQRMQEKEENTVRPATIKHHNLLPGGMRWAVS